VEDPSKSYAVAQNTSFLGLTLDLNEVQDLSLSVNSKFTLRPGSPRFPGYGKDFFLKEALLLLILQTKFVKPPLHFAFKLRSSLSWKSPPFNNITESKKSKNFFKILWQ
jgi:hypothetical protein